MITQRKADPLLEQADRMKNGFTLHSATLNLSPAIVPALGAASAALDTTMGTLQQKLSVLLAKRKSRTVARQAAYAYTQSAVHLLRSLLGSTWNAEWQGTGFPVGTTAAPRTSSELLEALGAIARYLANHPTLEAPQFGFTAVKAGEVRDALGLAVKDAATAEAEVRETAHERDGKVAGLQRELRAAAEHVNTKLGIEDERWRDFGLRRPVDGRTPEVPGLPVVTVLGPGMVRVQWTRAKRATRHRVFLKSPADQEPQPIRTVKETDITLDRLPIGAPLELSVAAANRYGESQLTAPVRITLA